MRYNWQQADWPAFRYDLSGIEGELLAFADKAGQINGMLKGMSEEAKTEAILQIMIFEALKTSGKVKRGHSLILELGEPNRNSLRNRHKIT